MKRIVVLLLVLWVAASCGGKGDQVKEEETKPAAQATGGESVPAIAEGELSEFDKLVNGRISPYFDAEGTQSEKTVKPGENFDMYVVGEYNRDFAMCAAEYRLVLPQGMTVVASVNADSTILTMGDLEDFSTTFRCTSGPKTWLAKYICTTDPSFQGGEVRTEQGARLNFLGFSICDGEFTLVNARPGKAAIKVE